MALKFYEDMWVVYDKRDNTLIAEGTEKECRDYCYNPKTNINHICKRKKRTV